MRIRIAILAVFSVCLIGRPVFAASGVAQLNGTSAGSKVNGEVSLTEKDGGLEVVVDISNAPPGKHGFHIHEKGDCSDAGKAAGGHFNPDGVMHGMVAKDGMMHAHAGDFGNIEVGEDGTGRSKIFIPGLSLTEGKYDVAGKAVILHEKEDDFGQPVGNAGGRIGCGIIEVYGLNQMEKGSQAGEDAK